MGLSTPGAGVWPVSPRAPSAFYGEESILGLLSGVSCTCVSILDLNIQYLSLRK